MIKNTAKWRKERADYLNQHTLLAITVENKATYEAGATAMITLISTKLDEMEKHSFTLDFPESIAYRQAVKDVKGTL